MGWFHGHNKSCSGWEDLRRKPHNILFEALDIKGMRKHLADFHFVQTFGRGWFALWFARAEHTNSVLSSF